MNLLTRRAFLRRSALLTAAAGLPAAGSPMPGTASVAAPEEVLGQGDFRYRLNRFWGRLDRARHPVENCHAIAGNAAGQIVLLTDDTRNNLITYGPAGEFLSGREHRFPQAHALEVEPQADGERYWITDSGLGVISLCASDGRELRRIGPEAVDAKYPVLSEYRPSNVAVMPGGDFYVSDGGRAGLIHHFDPNWHYVASFGGAGSDVFNLKMPHSVSLDTRTGKPLLLVCDRDNAMLKWLTPTGEWVRQVPLPGCQPCNVSRWKDYLAVACRNGIILILDATNHVVSVVGGEPPIYQDDELQTVVPYNYGFNHPHDVHFDPMGNLYVAQADSYRTYPVKLDRLPASS